MDDGSFKCRGQCFSKMKCVFLIGKFYFNDTSYI